MLENNKQGGASSSYGKAQLNSTQIVLQFITLLVPNLIVLAIVYPGFLQADHQNTIAYMANGQFDEWHSLLWGFFAYPFLYLSPSIGIYGIVQLLVFAVSILYSIRSLQSMSIISNRSSWLLIGLFSLSPTFLIYNELYSSDVIFSILLAPLTVLLIKIWHTKGEILSHPHFLIALGLLYYVIFELRKNAVLIIVFGFMLTFSLFKMYRKQTLLLFTGCITLIICTSMFNSLILHSTKSPSQELLSVPVQQIGRAVADGGEIPMDAQTSLEKIRPMDEWKSDYHAENSDYLKFNNKHPEKQKVTISPEFIKAWAKIGIKNPKSYIRAYIDLMYPYWQLGADRSTSYIFIDFANHDNYTIISCNGGCRSTYIEQFNGQNTIWQERFGRIDLIVDNLHIPALTDAIDLLFFNRALPLWLFATGLLIAIRKKMTRYYLLISLPLWCILLSLLAFSPVSCFRYALQMYYLIPPLIAVMVFACKKGKQG